ncbi:MAG: PAS domain S-box protein [Chloroflexota bacterium]|nr:MAG: PAS domain S-box protein [Chloroflexota bacterium]
MSWNRNAHRLTSEARNTFPSGSDKSLEKKDLRVRSPFRSRHISVVVALYVGVALCIGLFVIVGKWEDERERDRFDEDVASMTSRLERSLASDREVLGSIGGLYAASVSVDRTEFGVFVAGALSRHPHIQALEWIPFVPSSERRAYEESARADGYPGFQFTEKDSQGNIVPASERPAYFPVYYVEPLVGNEVALGFDLGSNPERLEALERARDSGTFAATSRITLVQETGQQFGLLIFLPIYRNGASPNTVEERRALLSGFALAVFRIGDLIEQSFRNLDSGPYSVRLYDIGAPEGQSLLYASMSAGDEADSEYGSGPNKIVRLEVGGRQWSLVVYPKSGRLPTLGMPIAGAILAFGLLATMGLVTYLVLAQRQADKLSRANTELRESEERYRRLVELFPDAVIVFSQGEVTFVNTAAVKLLGAEEATQLVGQPLLQLVHPDFREAWTQRIRLLEAGDGVSFIGRKLLRLDGTPVDVEAAATPLVLNGKMAVQAVVRDITDRKRAEQCLEQTFEKLQQTLEDSVRTMARMVEMRDPYTAGHQERVAVLAYAIAKEMGLPDEQIRVIRLAAAVHDLGKVSVPSEILSKPGRLDETEFGLVKNHPTAGREILETIRFPWPIATIVLQHHERMNGSGYPTGLNGKDILLGARILAVADVVDAMSSHRPYRPALGIDAALKEVTRNKGVLYDVDVVDAFVRILDAKPLGFSVGEEVSR